jgi:hypothetical protein
MRPEGWVELPAWLAGAAHAVLADLQGSDPIPDVSLYATPDANLDGVVLGLFERGSGGGRFVRRSVESTAELLVEVAEILQDELSETAGGWGQSRPRCPYHPHPARPRLYAAEAWWGCPERDERLFRIGPPLGG